MSATPPSDQGASRLALLYRLSQTLNSSLDLDLVLSLLIDEVIAATRAERGFVMLLDGSGRLAFHAARGIDQTNIDDPEAQVSRGVIERVAKEGLPLLTSNAQDEGWLSGRQSVVILGLRSVMCAPLIFNGSTLGVVYVDNRLQAGIFTRADLDLLSAIAASAAVAVENARLYRLAVEKGRMERELQLARDVQARLIPRRVPNVKGWAFAAEWQPAREMAGDFYDFVPHPRKQLSIVVADVADKGMPAALYMALTRSIMRACLQIAREPADVIAQANQLICADTAYGMFVTVFYARLNFETGEMTYANAGHIPPLVCRPDAGEVQRLTRTGMALGVEPTTTFEQRSLTLAPGEFVLLYTDGVTDAVNERGEEFGDAGVRAVLKQHCGQTAPDVAAGLREGVRQFVGAASLADDITFVVIRRDV